MPINDAELVPIPLKKQLAILTRQHRQARRMSQAKLAQRAGTTQPAIARIEAGSANPTLSTLESLAKVLNLQPHIRFTRLPRPKR